MKMPVIAMGMVLGLAVVSVSQRDLFAEESRCKDMEAARQNEKSTTPSEQKGTAE